MHSYELPALVWWPIDGEDKYAQWVIECVETEWNEENILFYFLYSQELLVIKNIFVMYGK